MLLSYVYNRRTDKHTHVWIQKIGKTCKKKKKIKLNFENLTSKEYLFFSGKKRGKKYRFEEKRSWIHFEESTNILSIRNNLVSLTKSVINSLMTIFFISCIRIENHYKHTWSFSKEYLTSCTLFLWNFNKIPILFSEYTSFKNLYSHILLYF